MSDIEVAKNKLRKAIRNLDNMNTLMHDADDDEVLRKCKWELLWFLKSGRSFYPMRREEFDTAAAAAKYGDDCLRNAEKNLLNTIQDLLPDCISYKELSHFLPIPVKATT